MIQLRRSGERGHANHGWLDSHHSFSFANYYDPEQMGFGTLRVINDDRVAPGAGFPTHPHRDMEIISYVVEGALEHRDSLGNGSVIRPGDVQRMTAGTGVTHSEFNPSKDEALRFLQLWILPDRAGLEPGYEQKHFGDERRGQLRLMASPDGSEGSVRIHQDARIYGALLSQGETLTHSLAADRRAWLQVVRGSLRLDEQLLREGDGAAIQDHPVLVITASADTELLLFDLAG